MKFPSLYFNWLQKNNPTGTVDKFPELKNRFETSVPGLYCIGDLTGIPLIKLAAESGYDMIQQLHDDPSFKKQIDGKTDADIYDIIIVGGGTSGISAGIHAQELGYNLLIIESSRLFNTILNFPKGKPI
jgi:thioredoxin reductase